MKPQKILLTGVNGQVGHALAKKFHPSQLAALSRSELDLSNAEAIRRAVREIKPDLIINPAAYTAVDKAETEPALAHAINAIAPQVLAEEADRAGAKIIHFSTDYVFDGLKNSPYIETDSVNPKSVYGQSKLAGEQAISAVGLPHLIVRTSWVYGPYGRNFLKSVLRLAQEQSSLNIVADQIGAPTSCQCIADAIFQLVNLWEPDNANQTGIYHMTNAGSASWYEFACDILKEYKHLHKQPEIKFEINQIKPISTAEYPTLASRPANSKLDNSKLAKTFGIVLPRWQDGLKLELAAI